MLLTLGVSLKRLSVNENKVKRKREGKVERGEREKRKHTTEEHCYQKSEKIIKIKMVLKLVLKTKRGGITAPFFLKGFMCLCLKYLSIPGKKV